MRRFLAGLAALCFTCLSLAQVANKSGDLDKLDFEQLMNVQVTTASKRPQSLSDVPAAIYVITQEEIHRSGARVIPELLRMVPGLQVGQETNGIWRVSARGFGGRSSDKLLVLVDGRSVYTSLFSGVFWETLDLPLEDIDRIEVVRGPGGALWGANAVNGVINIITKRASETQGGLASGSAEADAATNSGQGTLRYGSKMKDGYYRVYLHQTSLPSGKALDGQSANDELSDFSAGLRADWKLSPSQDFSLSAGASRLREGQSSLVPQLTPPFVTDETYNFGATDWNVVGKWSQTSPHGNESLQAYAQGQNRGMPEVPFRESTLDLEWQKEVDAQRTRLIYGLDLRTDRLDTTGGAIASFQPPINTSRLASAFVHEEVTLNSLTRLEFGTKLEATSGNKPDLQPSIRILHTEGKNRSYWASISRAVRTPSDAETSDVLNVATLLDPNSGLPVQTVVHGTQSFGSESVVAYEAGVRARLSERTSLDASSFFNVYDGLRSFVPGQPFYVAAPTPHLVLPVEFGNGLKGSTAGLEVSLRHRPSPNWNLVANMTAFSTRLRHNPLTDVTPLYGQDGRGQTPRYQASLASYYSPSSTTDFDAELMWNDKEIAGPVQGYWLANLRWAWRPRTNLELQLSVQNLFASRTLQGSSDLFEELAVPARHFYLGATYRF